MRVVNAPSPFQFAQAMSVLQAMRTKLVADDPEIVEDETLLQDMLEGQTDCMETLHAMIRAAIVAESMEAEAYTRAKAIMARSVRYEIRAQWMRGAVLAAMDALGLNKIELADCTSSLSKGRPTLVVMDQDLLPEQYLRRVETVTPNKVAIKAAIDAGEEIPGAILGNAMPFLRILTR